MIILNNNYKLLLIEDNPYDIYSIQKVLSELGIDSELSVINNGKKALDYLESINNDYSEKPNLIILDLSLPQIPGNIILKYVKTSIHIKHIPIMIFSAINNQKTVDNLYKEYANCFIQKPDDPELFYNIIKKSIYDFWIKTVTLPINK